MISVLRGVHLASLVLAGQTADQVKSTFSIAIATSDGKKLHSVLSAKELNGATVQACSSFLQLVTKPRISKLGTYDQSRTHFTSILDPRSPMMVKFRDTGGASILITEKRTVAFEPAIAASPKGSKASTGFADLAFWAAHLDPTVKSAKGTLNRAKAAHKLFESWVPKFEKMGIKGSIDSESKKYMTWKQILDTSLKEIQRIKDR